MLTEGVQNINNSDFTVSEPESLGDLRTTSDMYVLLLSSDIY